MNNKPGGTFLYDSLDKENPKPKTDKADWRERIPFYTFLSFLILVAIGLFIAALQMLNSYDERVIWIGQGIILIEFLSIVLLAFGRISIYLYTEYNKAHKERLINVFEYQTTYDKLDNILTPYFAAMQERMHNTIFAGVQNLTYSPSSTRSELPQEQKQIDIDTPVIMEELPALETLQRDGLIGRSGNSILLGFEDESK